MSAYDDFDRALLRAGKRAPAPTSRMRARALGAAAAAGAATAATTKAAAATKVGLVAKATKTALALKFTMAVAVTTATVGTAVYVAETRPAPNEAPVVVSAPAPVRAPVFAPSAVLESAPLAPIETAAPAAPIAQAVAKPAPAPPRVPPSPPAASQPKPIDPLREELGLVEDARRSLAAGDATSALRRVDDHAQRFPTGVLAVERDALRIDALVAAGRRDEAATRASDFLAHHPGSAQAGRIAKIAEKNP